MDDIADKYGRSAQPGDRASQASGSHPLQSDHAARPWPRMALLFAAAILLCASATATFAQTPGSEVPGSATASGTTAAGVVPLAEAQPPARVIVDPPLPAALARGVVVLQYRAENIRIVPVFGPAALAVSPRIGHLHITVDDLPWDWADASGIPVIIQNLPPGPHRALVELADANHHILDHRAVEFSVPNVGQQSRSTHAGSH